MMQLSDLNDSYTVVTYSWAIPKPGSMVDWYTTQEFKPAVPRKPWRHVGKGISLTAWYDAVKAAERWVLPRL